jgi:predicted ATPase
MFRQFETISYLGPLRAPPRRTEQWNQQRPGSIGPDGSGAIKALLASANDRTNSDDLIDQISKWLHRMGAADRLEPRRLGSSTHYEVRVVRAGLDCNLLDVGFGISQVLPVLTLAYFAPENSTVIIEEPEIHLHPLAQRLLADLFVEVARERRIQFLVETHSEHLFRRLQYLIAAQEIDAEQCRLYFVEQAHETAELRTLQLDTYGRIANWPEKFFGDAIGDTEEQMSRMLERMISAQESGQ